jgi:protein SCO1/2
MNSLKALSAVLAIAVSMTVAPPTTAGDATVASYYALDVVLETQAAESLSLSDLEGEPTVVAMFYGSCGHVCPMIISTIGMVENQLPPGARDVMRVLMISLDPERDTPEVLAELAKRHRVDPERWQFARSAPDDVRLIASMLNVKYRVLPDGVINHSSPILLLDEGGRELTRTEKLGVPDPLFVQAVAAALAQE